jgi:hypothetical protein
VERLRVGPLARGHSVFRTLDEAGPIKALNVLDIAWAKGFTPTEAALLIAYSVAGGFAGGGYIYRAQHLLREKIRPVQDDWLKKGIVRQEVVRGWYPKAEEDLRKHRERSHWPGKPSSGNPIGQPRPAEPVIPKELHVLPHVMRCEPARIFRLDGRLCLFLRDVGPYVDFDHMQGVPNVRFPFVLVLCSPKEEGNFYVVAVEKPVDEKPRMVEFVRVEEKRSLGIVAAPVDEQWFIEQAMRITAARFNIEPHWQELPPPSPDVHVFGSFRAVRER